MKMKLLAFLFASILVSAAFADDTAVGKVVSFSGSVLIDSFGKGAFIAPIRGDVLYSATVIKTGVDGKATIELQGKSREIPPGAEVKIADILSATSRKGALGWLQAVGNLFKSFSEFSKKKEDELVLGKRAANASDTGGEGNIEWEVEESDPVRALPEVEKDIERQNYLAALEKLTKIEQHSDPIIAWKVSFWKGFAYYQLEDYGDAAANLTAAYQAMKSMREPPGTLRERRVLLFQLGASRYLIGQEKSAIPLFDAYLADSAGDEYEPYAYLFLAKALSSTGDARKSRAVAEEAMEKFKGTDIESEFASLLK